MNAHITFVFPKLEPNRLVDLALCVVLAKRHYTPIVHTNLVLPDELRKHCEIRPRVFAKDAAELPWTYQKFLTYRGAEDGEPFLHLDSDVFLDAALPRWLTNAPMFVQTDCEPPEWYAGIEDMPPEWRAQFMPAPWRAMCMGVFGGDPALVREYAEMAIRACPECAGRPRGHVISEQAVLGRFVNERGVRVASLTTTLADFPRGYAHLMSRKDVPSERIAVERRLWQLNPVLAKAVGTPEPYGCILTSNTSIRTRHVRAFYRGRTPRRGQQLHRIDPATVTLTSAAAGLGDAVILTDIERTARQQNKMAWAHSGSSHWPTLVDHCPGHQDRKPPWSYDLLHGVWQYGLGNGHIIQRAQRLCQLHVHPVPRGLVIPKLAGTRKDCRVGLHLEPSQNWSEAQQAHVHPRARKLYPRSLYSLTALIDQSPESWSYIEFGNRPTLNHPAVENRTGKPLAETIRLMAECEYFIGIDSGPMHLAAALGLKSVVLINFPHPDKLMLPVLVSEGLGDEWLYPQNVHLHQDVDSAHMPLVSADTLRWALQGSVYPYWSTEVLSDLEEEIQ